MSEIDWENAPEGATHWDGQFYKLGDDFSYYFDSTGYSTGWKMSVCERDAVMAMTPKPLTTTWNGEGLPPVGVECEFINDREWFPCKILFVGRIAVVYEHEGTEYVNDTDDIKFRPLKSEKDKAIDKLMKSFYSLHTPTDIATAIYKAGYRLPDA